MLSFIKNFFKTLFQTASYWIAKHSLKIVVVLAAVIVLMMLFGCADQSRMAKIQAEGPGYCKWEAAPAWVAKDFITDPQSFGLMNGFHFIGNQGQDCYLLMVDLPKADGTCDVITAVCETGSFDTRHGPDTPLVMVIGRWECSQWDAIIDQLVQYADKNKV